ncbi:hypothetical protein ASD14_06625 [Lysobacter sp. Root494]|nr:hypothetical protein ASD14_06625 [Lysobacter sp. Root494]
MAPRAQDVGDWQWGRAVLQQVDSFANRLQHSKFDAVVHKFDEVPGARRSGVNKPTIAREFLQDGRHASHGGLFAAYHETCSIPGALEAAARAGIDKGDPASTQSTVAANGVTPIGIPTVDNHVSGIKDAT